MMIGDRYRIVRQLQQENRWQLYLAEDTHRFHEACWLKEIFSPNSPEGKILYHLHHPQIPCFRETFPSDSQTTWVVFDAIAGESYQDLRDRRLQEDQGLTEKEAIQLLLDILPVFEYLHNQGIVHNGIDIESFWLSDKGLPILIHFHQAQFLPCSPFFNPSAEQTSSDSVSADNDLFALAATILKLLTANTSSISIAPHTLDGNPVPTLSWVLTKMLAPNPQERFQSAQEAWQAISQVKPTEPQEAVGVMSVHPTEPIITPMAIASGTAQSEIADSSLDSPMSSTSRIDSNPLFGCLSKLVLVFLLSLGAGMAGWLAGKAWLNQALQPSPSSDMLKSPASEEQTQTTLSEEEVQRRNEIATRRRELGINRVFFTSLINEEFRQAYPERKGKVISEAPEDTQWREKWDQLALAMLDKLKFLSPEALGKLGSYDQQQRNFAVQQANQLRLSSRALYDLADATFFAYFPEQENQAFLEHPLGQVWHGIVFDSLQELQSGKAYEAINNVTDGSEIALKGNLESGKGKAYVVNLEAGNNLDLQLETSQDTWLSIYSPTGKNNILEDSKNHQWSGVLPETGYYEITIVSKTKQSFDYQLRLKVVSPSQN